MRYELEQILSQTDYIPVGYGRGNDSNGIAPPQSNYQPPNEYMSPYTYYPPPSPYYPQYSQQFPYYPPGPHYYPQQSPYFPHPLPRNIPSSDSTQHNTIPYFPKSQHDEKNVEKKPPNFIPNSLSENSFKNYENTKWSDYYDEICPLKSGAFGKVIKAKNKKTGEFRAAKIINIKDFSENEIQNEVNIMKKCHNNNIVQIYEL